MKKTILIAITLFSLNISALCAGKKPEPIDTSNWAVYVDTTTGYEIKYPSDKKTRKGRYKDSLNNNVDYFSIGIAETGTGMHKIGWSISIQVTDTPEKIPAKGWFFNLPSAPGDEDIPFDKDEPIKINNAEGHILVCGGFVFAAFEKGDRMVSVEYRHINIDYPKASKELTPIFEAILHSYRWIEPDKEKAP